MHRPLGLGVTGGERPSDGRHGLVLGDVLLDVLRVALRLEGQGRTGGTGGGEVVGTGLCGRVGRSRGDGQAHGGTRRGSRRPCAR